MNPLVAQLLDRASAQVDPDFWDYVMRGCGGGVSAGEAASAWRRYRLSPRVLRAVDRVELSTELFGDTYAGPIGIAPTAFHKGLHPDGEAATRRGAATAGVPFVLSSRCTTPIEEVAAAADGPWWFQVYVTIERSVTEGMVRRAEAAGARALVLTADTPYIGHRTLPGQARPVRIADDLFLCNMGQHLDDTQRKDPWAYIDQDPATGPEVVKWLRKISKLPVIVKGVLRIDDAHAFIKAGAKGLWVSNHGGRQLDRVVSTAAALPGVVSATGNRVPVIVDGGIRDGIDALTALGLGADAVFVGRPPMWALACGGADGVAEVMTELTEELRHWLGLAGATDVHDLQCAAVVLPD